MDRTELFGNPTFTTEPVETKEEKKEKHLINKIEGITKKNLYDQLLDDTIVNTSKVDFSIDESLNKETEKTKKMVSTLIDHPTGSLEKNTVNISQSLYDPKDIQIIFDQVPEGIVLKDCGYGYGMFASKSFKAGETLYRKNYTLISDEERTFLIRTNQGDFKISTATHSVIMGKGKRALYTFDAHINHSCNPNTYSKTTPEMVTNCEYDQVASKDIKEGDELTCDYNLFDYYCPEKNIVECHCGSDNCRKSITGFKGLPLSEQLELLPRVDISIQEQFLEDNPNHIINSSSGKVVIH